MNPILARQSARTATIARAVAERTYRRAVCRVCRIVEDAGGQFSGLVAQTAQYKARSVVVTDPDAATVLTYHAVTAARAWEGRADEALARAVRRVTRAMGTLLEDCAVQCSLNLLLEIAATGHPQALPPDVAENIRARRERGS